MSFGRASRAYSRTVLWSLKYSSKLWLHHNRLVLNMHELTHSTLNHDGFAHEWEGRIVSMTQLD